MLIRCEVDSEMNEADYQVIGIGCDVSSELSVQQAFRRVMDTYGRIDSVVASAGPCPFRRFTFRPSSSLASQASSRTTPRSTTPSIVSSDYTTSTCTEPSSPHAKQRVT